MVAGIGRSCFNEIDEDNEKCGAEDLKANARQRGLVTVDKQVPHGTPCFANTRVPVQTLVDLLETGETIDDFLAVYPMIHEQRVLALLN